MGLAELFLQGERKHVKFNRVSYPPAAPPAFGMPKQVGLIKMLRLVRRVIRYAAIFARHLYIGADGKNSRGRS